MASFAYLIEQADEKVLGHLGGVPVLYTPTPQFGAPVTVTGMFDESFVRADVSTPGVASTGPAVFLQLAALPSDPAEEDFGVLAIEIAGRTFRVRDAEKDGMGGVLLHLAERDT